MREMARRLILALNNIDEAYYINVGKRKLSDAELIVLYALDDEKPHSQQEISKEWILPKTSVNTIVKRWEKEGLLTLTPIVGKRREMHISLTKSGKVFAKSFLRLLYLAEENAIQKTIEKYSTTFIDAIEFFGKKLKEEFNR